MSDALYKSRKLMKNQKIQAETDRKKTAPEKKGGVKHGKR